MQLPISHPINGYGQLHSSRLASIRGGLRGLFTGTSGPRDNGAGREGPKTPSTTSFPSSTRPAYDVPPPTPSPSHTQRSRSRSSSRRRPASSRPITPISFSRIESSPAVPPLAYRTESRQTRQVWGVGPDEEMLAALVGTGRQRSQHQPGNKRKARQRLCLPRVKDSAVRAKLLSCFLSGSFLAVTLSLYLGLALSGHVVGQEFHILFIMVILVMTIYFCHSLIRLIMLAMDKDDPRAPRVPSIVGPGGYANPREPIRVRLAHDEEAAGVDDEATKSPPPAYGLWRCSVRVDPNLLYWQRNSNAEPTIAEEDPSRDISQSRPGTSHRPPSYVSDDGVTYAISAAPRLPIAAQYEAPLPPHPSEAGRVGQYA